VFTDVRVVGSGGEAVSPAVWSPSVQPELDVRNTTNGLGGMGLPPYYQESNQSPRSLAPPGALQLPTGAYFYQGQFFAPDGSGLTRNYRSPRFNLQANRTMPNLPGLPQLSPGNSDVTNTVVQRAMESAGTLFREGVQAMCAVFVRDVFQRAGVDLGVARAPVDGLDTGPALANSFFDETVGTVFRDTRQLRPGDIVGFANTYGNWAPGTITHVGVYVGNGMMVDRSTSAGNVHHRPISTFNLSGFVAVRPHGVQDKDLGLGQGMSPTSNPNPVMNRSQQNIINRFNPMRGERASTFRSDYSNANNRADNYGYDFLATQNGFRVKLHETSERLGIPTQWLADVIAATTGGTFQRGWRDGRVGLIGWTQTDADRMGINLHELAHMNHSQQLDVLYNYLSKDGALNGQYTTLEQLWMAVHYNPDTAMRGDMRTWLRDPGVRSGLERLPQIGQHAGRRYSTLYDVFGGDHTTHTGNHANCPTCRGLQNANGGGRLNMPSEPPGMRVASPNLKPEEAAFLDTISRAEGTYANDGYQVQVGYTNRTQGWQPFRVHEWAPGQTSTATGRYQFMQPTWNQYARGLDINNPQHQDQVALRLIREARNAGAIFDAIKNNDYATFNRLVNGGLGLEWVGLTREQNYPGQRGNTPTEVLWNFARDRYRIYSQGNVPAHTNR
jgi:cell wall-associated NlpC family hydrolase